MASSTATAPATAPVASTALSAEAFRVVHPLEYHLKFLEQGVRPDGRPFLHARKASANMRQISSAHGSALVRMGDTVVVAGVQCEPCVPSEAEPTRGRVTVSLELAATSALGKRGGASAGGGGGYYSRRELEREHEAIGTLLGRTAMGGLIDLDALVIAPARAVWSCHCSLYVLEHDGNAIDAAFVALLCALRDTRIPAVRLEETETGDQAHVTSTGEPPLPLPLGRPIFSVTFGLLEGYLLLDPSREVRPPLPPVRPPPPYASHLPRLLGHLANITARGLGHRPRRCCM